MNPLNQGRRFTTDHVDVIRTAVLVEQEDVGSVLPGYLGQHEYEFQPQDVGRLIETVENMSPGFFSWGFGSIFLDLRDQYPDPFPYVRTA